jgi:hypothetical protein
MEAAYERIVRARPSQQQPGEEEEEEEEDALLWRRWLWGCDCNALPLEQCCDMNEMHALGVLVCLRERTRPVSLFKRPLNEETVGGLSVLHLHVETPVCALSLRELLDQLECLQLNWGPALSDWGPDTALKVLRALMARLGGIAHRAFPVGGQVLDDTQHVTPLPAAVAAGLGVVSRKSLRQALCVLFALLRVRDVVARAMPVPRATPAEVAEVVQAMRQHHAEASMDTFNTLQQMLYLAPGQRLAYRMNFAGMYNDVSQVVYFHHPRYCRKAQLELPQIPRSPMHMVPLIMQLLPQIGIGYEDDSLVPGLTTTTTAAASAQAEPDWLWLGCCGTIFLVDVRRRIVYHHEEEEEEEGEHEGRGGMSHLVAHYLRATAQTIAAAEAGGGGGGSASAALLAHMVTPCSHVSLLASS